MRCARADGGVPKWPTGAVCKIAGAAFAGSNPAPTTPICNPAALTMESKSGGEQVPEKEDEQPFFVDRRREISTFTNWLKAPVDEPPILSVSGPGGVGKSYLLRQFDRVARGDGRDVLYGDARTFAPKPEDLQRALAGDPRANLVDLLNRTKPILMLDTFEEMSPLSRWMQEELLPGVDEEVRLVFAGRQPLGHDWAGWGHRIMPISLSGFSQTDAGEYLQRRGIIGVLAEQIIRVTGGHPLALALAADLAIQRGLREFGDAPEWNVTLRLLVDTLVGDVRQKEARDVLEAAAIVRQFDEELLAQISDSDDVHEAFAQLCRFSFVRSSRHGLMLHDDIRRLLLEDLKWRKPERAKELRRRAQEYYQRRMRGRRSDEVDWVVAERLYLWENALFQTMYFPEGDPSAVWVEVARPEDKEEILRVHSIFYADPTAFPATPALEEASPEFMEKMFDYPGAEFDIARDREGRILAFAFSFYVCKESMALLPEDGAIRGLLDRAFSPETLRILPQSWTASNIRYMTTIVPSPADEAGAGFGPIGQHGMKFLSRPDILLTCTSEPLYATSVEAIGFVKVPEVGPSTKPGQRVDGWMLDLTLIGPDGWLSALAAGRRPPSLGIAQLPAAVREALADWGNDEKLAESPLLAISESLAIDAPHGAADAVRRLIMSALEKVRSTARADDQEALKAVQMAYIDRLATHEQIADQLSVSRSTFFRLLKRGTERVAEAVRRLVSEGAVLSR
jgi:predicted DNA-binding protein (UPF0251 family)